MNFFSAKSAAERFAAGRPYFHPLIIDLVRESISFPDDLSKALDVGCGTGLSTVALSDISAKVFGIDASTEMIYLAPQRPGIEYIVSLAENLPFGENEFELITMSQIFHWLDRKKFFVEARRVLRPKGWIVIYDNYFSGRMQGNEGFEPWYRGSYLKHYPIPPRAWASFTSDELSAEGFHLFSESGHENKISFAPETLMNYLMTQSNIIAAIENGNERIENVQNWLIKNVSPFFENAASREFYFHAPVWFMQRFSS